MRWPEQKITYSFTCNPHVHTQAPEKRGPLSGPGFQYKHLQKSNFPKTEKPAIQHPSPAAPRTQKHQWNKPLSPVLLQTLPCSYSPPNKRGPSGHTPPPFRGPHPISRQPLLNSIPVSPLTSNSLLNTPPPNLISPAPLPSGLQSPALSHDHPSPDDWVPSPSVPPEKPSACQVPLHPPWFAAQLPQGVGDKGPQGAPRDQGEGEGSSGSCACAPGAAVAGRP